MCIRDSAKGALLQLDQLYQGALGVPAQNKLHQLGRLQVSRQAQRLSLIHI